MTEIYKLTKHMFMNRWQCHRKVWLAEHRSDLAFETSSLSSERRQEHGKEVGEKARHYFPGGILISEDHFHIHEAIEHTEKAIRSGVSTLFEACFIHDGILVRPDVLIKDESDQWQIIEVKSTTEIKLMHIWDVAIQLYVLEGYGLKISDVQVMVINSSCTYPNLDNLFVLREAYNQVKNSKKDVQQKAQRYLQTLDLDQEPQREIGYHCTYPHDCMFIQHCWKDVPSDSIFTIPYLRQKQKESYLERGILELNEVPESDLTPHQIKYLHSFKSKSPSIDIHFIQNELDQLTYPLHFLDFETDAIPIPKFSGMKPYAQFPFQFSCHILHEDGKLDHKEYLHRSHSDPRPNFVKHLLKSVGQTGSVIAYNASFEKRIIHSLIEWNPDLKEELKMLSDRLWDQLSIFRNHYIDYRFHGSSSLKNVAPVVVSHISYDGLNIQDGMEAQAIWNIMIRTKDEVEREKLRQDLYTYCGTDTLAMVELHRVLMNLT